MLFTKGSRRMRVRFAGRGPTTPGETPAAGTRRYHRVPRGYLDGRGSHHDGSDTVTRFLARIVAWITSGYPDGVPGPDRVPLLALLRRRLSEDEVRTVAQDLIDRGEFDRVDIGVLITQVTDELPTAEDIERVRSRLAAQGWPLDGPRDPEGDP